LGIVKLSRCCRGQPTARPDQVKTVSLHIRKENRIRCRTLVVFKLEVLSVNPRLSRVGAKILVLVGRFAGPATPQQGAAKTRRKRPNSSARDSHGTFQGQGVRSARDQRSHQL
jgi:hypothetical protein